MRVLPFGAVLGSLSDLLGLRPSLPLQSRPTQISDGTQNSIKHLELYQGNIATISCPPTRTQRMMFGRENIPMEELGVVACVYE